MLWNAKGIHQVEHVFSNGGAQFLKHLGDQFALLHGGHQSVNQKESQVAVDAVDGIQGAQLCHGGSVPGGGVLLGDDEALKRQALNKGHGDRLDEIALAVHPNVESLGGLLAIHLSSQLLDERLLAQSKQFTLIVDLYESFLCSQYVAGQLGSHRCADFVVVLLGNHCEQLLGDFLHQHAIVSLGRHTCVSKANNATKAVRREVSLSAASLAASGDDLLGSPSHQGFDGAAQDNGLPPDIGIVSLGGRLEGDPALLCVIESKVTGDGAGNEGCQGTLLQLVGYEGVV
mmetsp:Transcript_15159/g.37508  ORF Transcript_15159/g.37508 Transcript_15159/m.37508 type:complete len:287 (+) Transcript_15159:183-1043(+)